MTAAAVKRRTTELKGSILRYAQDGSKNEAQPKWLGFDFSGN
jgi:hypothetical protein